MKTCRDCGQLFESKQLDGNGRCELCFDIDQDKQRDYALDDYLADQGEADREHDSVS